MQFWWEKYPGRLEYEIDELKALGAKIKSVNKEISSGQVRLEFEYPYTGQMIAIRTLYPAHYPLARFEVLAPELLLERHQNRFGQNLCVLTRTPASWDSRFTIGNILNERLPKILAAQSPEAPQNSELEEPQGEPRSAELPYAPDAVFIVSSDWKLPPNVLRGRLTLGFMDSIGVAVRGVVLIVCDENNNVLATASPELAQIVTEKVDCEWYRLDKNISSSGAKQFLGEFGLKIQTGRAIGGLPCTVTGFVQTEEVEYRTFSDSWVFVVSLTQDRAGFRKGHYTSAYFARAARLGKSDVTRRIPMTSALKEKRIAVAGAGCLGAAGILEFAKAGTSELRIVDHDIVEPATAVRWPLGIAAAGRAKVAVLKEFIESNYPFSAINALQKRIGGTAEFWGATGPDIDKFCHGADLVFDATVDDAANDILAGVAQEKQIPYVLLSGTEGGVGGRVVLIDPKGEMCWTCWLYHLSEDPAKLVPPSEPSGRIRPIGCSEPTFTGANYDMQEVSLTAVRAAVSLLSPQHVTNWNAAILSLQSESDPHIPVWTTYNLKRHSECPHHKT